MFAGTLVVGGAARAVVCATGADTEVGRIAAATTAPSPRTPLQQRLDRFAGTLLRVAGIGCLALAALSWAYGTAPAESVLVGVSLAVAAVPEGLPVVVTVTLALGMRRMAERGAVVRRLHAVETLGSSTVICSDKTGTLTENRLTLQRVWTPDGGGAAGLGPAGQRSARADVGGRSGRHRYSWAAASSPAVMKTSVSSSPSACWASPIPRASRRRQACDGPARPGCAP